MLTYIRKAVVSTTVYVLLAASLTTTPVAFGQEVSVALFGDMPYTSAALPDAEARYERLIAHMNTFDIAFGVHVGDIKAGSTRCDDLVYARNLELFNSFKAPIVYTPGDNEWTDCHRLNNGNFAPLDRLALLRSTFFPSNLSLGQVPVELKRQPGYPENIRFIHGKLMLVTVHMPGSNNNRQQQISELVAGEPRLNPYYDGDVEYTARNAANMAWLEETLSFAANHPTIKGVVVAFQANPFERFLEPLSASNNNPYLQSGFSDFITKLRSKTLQLQATGKHVLAVHGDTHVFRTGQVLTDTYPGCDPTNAAQCVALPFGGTSIANFNRVEVFAQNNVHWVKVRFDPANPAVFAIEPMLVPGN